MKITLIVLFLAGLTIYCKCAAVLSLPPSLIAHAASLDESLKTQKPLTAKDTELKQQMLAKGNEEEANEPTLAADLYTNFKNLWHNDLSLSLQKREERNTFDDDIDVVAAMQQKQLKTMATIKRNNQNQNGLRPHDNDNVGHKNYNHNNNNKNKNYISKSSTSSLPYLRSSAATNMNEATNLNTNMRPQMQYPSQKFEMTEEYDDTNKWLSSSPEMIDDIFVSPPHQIQEPPLHLKRRELENMPFLSTAASTEDSQLSNRFLKSAKYWSRQCTLENENNCLQEYYAALIADRNNALFEQLHNKQNYPAIGADKSSTFNQYKDINEDDIILLLTAEQKLLEFLNWALSQLQPYGKFTNSSDRGENFYHPGLHTWRNLNLSGQLEPPLIVQEPHYVIMRREYEPDEDDMDYKRGLNYGEDPFIPPRGRKHNLPDLDSLLQRYETFVPNRGRRDKISDMFKNDDLFYPNRGKRQMTAAANDNGDIDERSGDIDSEDIKVNQPYYNNEQYFERHEMQHPVLSNELIEYIEDLMAKMKRKLHQPKQKVANIFDEMSNGNKMTTRMSTTYQQTPPAATITAESASPSRSLLNKRLKSMVNILHRYKKPHQQYLPNHYSPSRQWWKRYTAAKTSSKQTANNNDRPMLAMRSPTMATNRLQTTLKSMSPLQQLIQLYEQLQQPDLSPPHLRLDNEFMRQQQQRSLAQQFDPLSWHKLQLLLQQQRQHDLLQQQEYRHNQPLLTMRHPRLTALQHLPTIQKLQLATPQETQLTYSSDQLDNSITNDPDNLFNKNFD